MKITKKAVKDFESDQVAHGTAVAMYNLLWTVFCKNMKDLGVKRVRTSD